MNTENNPYVELEMQPRQTLRVEVSSIMIAELTRLCAEREMPRKLMIRQAIALFLRVAEADLRGERLALVDSDHRVLHEIILS